MSDIIGKEIGGYRILQQIGMGGMAKVYKAYQAKMDRVVALKVLPDHYAKDETFLKRFDQEARIIANLENRNILSVFDYGEDDGVAYLAMRYLRGGTLKDVLNSAVDRRLSMTDVAHVVNQLANALDYSHSQGIVHRDMKPSNVLVDENGDCYLTDFGIAKVLDSTSHLTSTGSTLGTPAYMSPEQAAGKNVGKHSDIYSLGIILYELMVGKVPFDSDTPFATVLAHVNEPIPLPSQANPDIPQRVEQVILKVLAKNPDDRYKDASDLAIALLTALEKEEIHVGGRSSLKVSDTLQGLSSGLAATRPNNEMTVDDIALAKSQQRKELLRKFVPAVVGLVIVGLITTISILLSKPGGEEGLDHTQAAAMMAEATGTQQAISNVTATQVKVIRDATVAQIGRNRNETLTAQAATRMAIALTPSPTATLSPSPTNTPTPVYHESGTLFFSEDFEDQATSLQFGYTRGDWDIVEYEGDFVLQASNFGSDDPNSYPSTSIGDNSWDNYRLSFDFFPEEESARIQFILYVRTGRGCTYGIEFSNEMNAYRDSGGQDCHFESIPILRNEVFISDEWNNVMVEVFENILVVYVNHQKIIHFKDFDDNPPTDGGVDITLEGYYEDNPARIIYFDNFHIAELISRGPTPTPTNEPVRGELREPDSVTLVGDAPSTHPVGYGGDLGDKIYPSTSSDLTQVFFGESVQVQGHSFYDRDEIYIRYHVHFNTPVDIKSIYFHFAAVYGHTVFIYADDGTELGGFSPADVDDDYEHTLELTNARGTDFEIEIRNDATVWLFIGAIEIEAVALP